MTQQPNKRRIRLQWFLTLLVLIPLVYYAHVHSSEFQALLELHPIDLVILSTIAVATAFFNAAQNAVLIRSFGVPLSNLESFGLSNISAIASLFIPQGMTIIKALYLRQRYAVSYARFSALFMGLLVIFLFIGATLMALTNTVMAFLGIQVPGILWLASLLGIASCLLFFLDIRRQASGKIMKLETLVGDFSAGWNQIRSNRACLIKASLWQLAIFISSGMGVTVAYKSIGITINPIMGVSLAVFIAFSNLIAIIPANLGLQELVFGYLSQVSGLPFVQGVVASALIRAVSLSMILIVLPFSWYFLFVRQKIKINQ